MQRWTKSQSQQKPPANAPQPLQTKYPKGLDYSILNITWHNSLCIAMPSQSALEDNQGSIWVGDHLRIPGGCSRAGLLPDWKVVSSIHGCSCVC